MPNQLAFLAFALRIVALQAWSQPLYNSHCNIRRACSVPHPTSTILFLAGEDKQDELVQDDTDSKSTAVYGVSYIGGDPCGSKYNDDPFDATDAGTKPGLPDDMKDRIAALAAKKAKELKGE